MAAQAIDQQRQKKRISNSSNCCDNSSISDYSGRSSISSQVVAAMEVGTPKVHKDGL